MSNRRDILEDYAKKMRDAENDDHEGKRKVESVWSVHLFLPETQHLRASHSYLPPCLTFSLNSPRNLSRWNTQADHADSTRPIEVHLRPVLQTRSDQPGTVRLALEGEVCGCQVSPMLLLLRQRIQLGWRCADDRFDGVVAW